MPSTLALDTNVLQALLERDHPLQARAVTAMKLYQPRYHLLISPFVYAEAFGMPEFDETLFGSFLEQLGVTVDETALPLRFWRRAGQAHAAYHARRRRHGHTGEKRILADFLIGAHALERGAALLTFDPTGYRAAFPELSLLDEAGT